MSGGSGASGSGSPRGPITINCDLGESIGLHAFGYDDELVRAADVANVACGMHAGDPGTMHAIVEQAVRAGTAVGAHPGLPDIVGFGRRAMELDADDVRDLVRYQVGALAGFLGLHGAPLHHIKPHGALYGMTARQPELARAVCGVARQYGVPVFGLRGTAHEQAALDEGVAFVGELYVDLDYRADGGLIVQRRPQPADPVAVAARVRSALDHGRIVAVDGTHIPVLFESICVHSDLHGAPDVVRAVRAELERASR